MRINGFEQIKAFYSWSFENQEQGIKSQHVSLYMFLVNQNNRNSWVEWFKLPMDLGMAGSCISSKKTYYACLADLQSWGLIEYQKGINDWKAPLIKLEVLKDTSSIPQSEPQVSPQLIPLDTPQLLLQLATQPIPNIKLLTNNFKLVTENIKEVLKFLNFSEETEITEELEIKKSELINLICEKYGYVEHRFYPKKRIVMAYVDVTIKNEDDYRHFINNFNSYIKYKTDAEEKQHGFDGLFGTQKEQFKDGALNSENWEQKILNLKTGKTSKFQRAAEAYAGAKNPYEQ